MNYRIPWQPRAQTLHHGKTNIKWSPYILLIPIALTKTTTISIAPPNSPRTKPFFGGCLCIGSSTSELHKGVLNQPPSDV
ncbi:unnamed protein product [Coffea canephora]|uniref:Uncharacterized protein n=1 Tax=Coffea canephora TaxID=49390 RepID=A0A068U420_COFCA|nr:unnamed protein product [Coffea canephora]